MFFFNKKRRKKIEETPKRNRGIVIVSSRFFPTDEELAELAETGQWDELVAARARRTAENAILQAREREPTFTNKDVIRLALLHADIRQVLNLAQKTPIIAIILKEKGFWKQKLEIDMPELFVPEVWQPLNQKFNIEEKYLNVDDVSKARGVYMVFRYLTKGVQHYIFQTNNYAFNPNGDESIRVSFKNFDRPNNKDLMSRHVTMDGNSVGNPVLVSFFKYFEDMFKIPAVMYLSKFLKGKVPTKYKLTWYGPASWFFWTQFNMQKPSVLLEGVKVLLPPSLENVLDRGYYKKDDEGRIFIGSEMCDHCQEKPKVLKLGCCEQVAYCSEECAKQGWAAHKEECVF